MTTVTDVTLFKIHVTFWMVVQQLMSVYTWSGIIEKFCPLVDAYHKRLVKMFLPQVNSEGCRDIRVTRDECQFYRQHEYEIIQQFPLQFVSGAPGSGNDWVRWLAALNSKSCLVCFWSSFYGAVTFEEHLK